MGILMDRIKKEIEVTTEYMNQYEVVEIINNFRKKEAELLDKNYTELRVDNFVEKIK